VPGGEATDVVEAVRSGRTYLTNVAAVGLHANARPIEQLV
jgi:hypothetical protein